MSTDGAATFLGDRGFPNARTTLCRWQRAALVALPVLLLLGLLSAGPGRILFVVNTVLTIAFFVSTLYRLYLIRVSLTARQELSAAELLPPGGEWPRYVVQVPLYHEGRALPHLIHGLRKLDYPPDRLTVQLLVEADDEETRAALARLTIEPPFTVVTIPVSEPRTKPKACNVGLAVAEGDFLVIYDAEDRPEPDQLKKAVLAFAQCPPDVACIQARLSFYNPTRNLLTRCFTAEYAMWFDLALPGLDRLGAPIPLGGTSNHFRLAVLRELQGWDEFNVTEDCDLGLRLFAAGWRTRMFNSTTWEEACPHFPAWIRQRSRWVKGYVQTYLVHTRDLGGLTRRLGLVNSFHFHVLIGGSVLFQLVAPLYWFLVVLWFLLQKPWLAQWPTGAAVMTGLVDQIDAMYPGPVFVMAAACLFAGNFFLVYGCAVAATARGFGYLVKFTPLMVIYWLMMSGAAWKGVLQLIRRPHFWEKTQHHQQ